MTNNTRKCDECKVTLNGECIVDGALLLCYECAEFINDEREFDGMDEREETDGDVMDDKLDLYYNEY